MWCLKHSKRNERSEKIGRSFNVTKGAVLYAIKRLCREGLVQTDRLFLRKLELMLTAGILIANNEEIPHDLKKEIDALLSRDEYFFELEFGKSQTGHYIQSDAHEQYHARRRAVRQQKIASITDTLEQNPELNLAEIASKTHLNEWFVRRVLREAGFEGWRKKPRRSEGGFDLSQDEIEIFRCMKRGISARETAMRLNELRYKPRKGASWTKNAVVRLATDVFGAFAIKHVDMGRIIFSENGEPTFVKKHTE